MNPTILLFTLLMLSAMGFYLGRQKSYAVGNKNGGVQHLHSRPTYYGSLTALWCAIPALIVFFFWLFFESSIITNLVISNLPDPIRELPPDRLNLVVNDIKNLVSGNIVSGKIDPGMKAAADHYQSLSTVSHASLSVIVIVIAIAGMMLVQRIISPDLRARNHVERVIQFILIACSTIAIFTTIGIVLSVLYEAIRFFKVIPLTEFVTGLDWSPQMAIRADQVGSSGAFGSVPVFMGTILISAIAMCVAVPIGLMSAIYLSEYAGREFRNVVKPLLEILAGIPTVVYGFFAALIVAPMIRDTGGVFGLDVSSESALAAGLVMGIMIIPFISSLSDDVINAVPMSLREGAYGLGSTKSETIRQVIIPAALPGIVGGVLLAVSRAIGETMIVVMAAGMAANLTVNPLNTVTTVTVQIVTLLVGDQEFDSPKTLAAFALGLMLFIVTLILNIIALVVVRKYREQYE
ncbi:high-affinity phosphate transport protein (ABC superfamily, membrane) [Desulfamplus magnetovallimortis]|uniref:Phosphate transport system permease protein n=1 Tax=Desulfamplus magnetovallimortis TaxID=1246637 RepID=A0A1W1HEG3_9BACT|nr:phosphate ABC transporter permease subunit PstC [Desulfamplus magnetovallimortis]SLM30765.1 high-affinity phosphate transport protein (ABC superfamily, membrane) [Desulfamplus magnetovallimortis]